MTYLTLKWIHIITAIIALGANLTYAIWLTRANQSPDSLLFTLKTIKLLDDRVANPAYVISLLSGFGMIYISGWTLTTPWIMLSGILYALVVVLGLFGYSPALSQQIKVVQSGGAYADAYAAVSRRAMILGLTVTTLVTIIVLLMVYKPSLWA